VNESRPSTGGTRTVVGPAGAWIAKLLAPRADGVPKTKPATLTYGLEEQPPPVVIWISAVQHVGVIAIAIIYPLIIAREAGLTSDQTINMLQLGMLVLAIATFLQALPAGPIGSRFLAPSIFTGVYLAPTLLAVKAGGLPLAWGMTIFAGVVEVALSRAWWWLRPYVPPESAGLVVFMVGAIIGLASLHLLLESNTAGALGADDGIVAGCVLAVMIGLNIWSRGRLKLFCILIGMIVGYVVSGALGLLTFQALREAVDRPLLALPSVTHISWAFDWSLAFPFAVTGLAAAMSATAVVTTYQRLTDADWVRPDMSSIGGGVLGDGIAAIVSGLLGTYGVTISAINVGLVAATGVASRVIAFAIAVILVLVALQPSLLGVLTVMPRPVMASALLFTAVFIMISGMQIISSRVLDGRRTLVIGMGMMTFIMVSVFPGAFAAAPAWAQPVVTSPLVLATLVALTLNLVFRLGIRRTVEYTVDPAAPDVKEISNFIERNAGTWGARREVISRIEFAVQQTIEAIIDACEIKDPIKFQISYDEFIIDAVITYAGAALEFPDHAPTHEQILETEDGHRRLAGFLIRRYADRIESSARNGAPTVLSLHFDQ
jgi:NCS2 family nucleobase:cation symporter-2